MYEEQNTIMEKIQVSEANTSEANNSVAITDKEHCSICGKTLDLFDIQEKSLAFDDVMGYGSKYDCAHIKFRLCCSCFDKFIDSMRENAKEDPVICMNVHFAGEMTNGQLKRLKQILTFLNQEGADVVVKKIGKMNSEEIESEICRLEEIFQVGMDK